MWVGGLAGIAYQQVTQDVVWPLLVAYLAMLCGPGVLGALVLRNSGGESDTPSSPSPSPPPSPPVRRSRRP